MSEDAETKAERIDLLVERSFKAWKHQNELLWGRLQSIATVQGAVVGGCYFLVFAEKSSIAPWLAFLLASLGIYLSTQIHELIQCDLYHRLHYSKTIKTHYPGFFAKPSGKKEGWKHIQEISKFFVTLNYVMAVLTGGYCFVIVIYWIACGCWITPR